MKKQILSFIENEDMTNALKTIIEGIRTQGFDDEYAILSATVNAYFSDRDGQLDMIKRGLDYNPSNYELHMMLASCMEEEDITLAYNEYEIAENYCFYQNSRNLDCDDYKYIHGLSDSFYSRKKEVIDTYKENLPFLIYKSEDICYGLLNHFADELAKALKNKGCRVEIFDADKTPIEDITAFAGRRFRAIIGIQSYLFSVEYMDGRNIHDFILGPKFNMLFDHPACMYKHFTKGPRDYYILTHDRYYSVFLKKKYEGIKDVFILPPAGEMIGDEIKKRYGLSFIGSYKKPSTWDGNIFSLDQKYGGKASELVDVLYENPNDTYEKCLEHVFGKIIDTKVYYDLKETYFKVMSIYRKKIIKEILDAGIKMDVFGDSWKVEPWIEYPNLHIHGDVDFEESLKIYAASLMSLNIMSWHKDGRTERIANIMLNHSLAVSDKTDFLKEEYQDRMLMFDLEDISSLPEKIRDLLEDENKIQEMSGRGYEKAYKMDRWLQRAETMLYIVDNMI